MIFPNGESNEPHTDLTLWRTRGVHPKEQGKGK